MATLYIFPDTSLLMHFERIDQLDWKALSGSKDVVLVLAPIVISELGKHKDQHPSRKLRERARRLSSWLRDLRRQADKRLPNGAVIEVAVKEPVEFLTGDLDPSTGDDRLIASVKAYAAQGKAVAVATDDTLLLHKLDEHLITAIELPAEKRLADEPDEVELENRTLRRKINSIEARRPSLELAWIGLDGHQAEILIRAPDMRDILSPREMAAQTPPMPTRSDVSHLGAMAVIGLRPPGVSESMVEGFNKALAPFHERYSRYYAQVQAIADNQRRCVGLLTELRNTGSGSATHIQIAMVFPDGVTPLERKPEWKFPDPPPAPERPGPYGLQAPIGIGRPSSWPIPSLHRRQLDPSLIHNPDDPEIDSKRRTVNWRRTRVLHGTVAKFDRVICEIGHHLIGTVIPISIEIHAEELPSPVKHQLELHITDAGDVGAS